MRLKEMFPDGNFAPPATIEQIGEVERELGIRLPHQLWSLYLECNGFRERKGNAKYLFSLADEDAIGSLISMTKFWWMEWPEIAPDSRLNFSAFVFFGSSSADEAWAMRCSAPFDIIAYHHHMGNEFEDRGTDILALYRDDYALYGDLD
jgi:hypothetical protein